MQTGETFELTAGAPEPLGSIHPAVHHGLETVAARFGRVVSAEPSALYAIRVPEPASAAGGACAALALLGAWRCRRAAPTSGSASSRRTPRPREHAGLAGSARREIPAGRREDRREQHRSWDLQSPGRAARLGEQRASRRGTLRGMQEADAAQIDRAVAAAADAEGPWLWNRMR